MIIKRYLVREVLQNFTGVMSVLVLVYLSSRMIRYLAEAAAGRIPADLILQLLVVKLLADMTLLLPLAMYLAILLGLGRMYRDSEVVAMTAGGVSIATVARTVWGLSLTFAAVAAALALYVSPHAEGLEGDLRARARSQTEISGIFPGRFTEFGRGDQVVYVESVGPERGVMRNVFVQRRRAKDLDILVAKRAYQRVVEETGDRYIVLENGHRYEGAPGSVGYVVTSFETHGVHLLRERGPGARRKLDMLPTSELWFTGDTTRTAELQWRVSMPISVLILAVLAVPMSRTSPRQGRYGRLFLAALIYFIYNNAIGIAQKLVAAGDLPGVIGVWPVHVAVGTLAVALVYRGATGRLRRGRARPEPAL